MRTPGAATADTQDHTDEVGRRHASLVLVAYLLATAPAALLGAVRGDGGGVAIGFSWVIAHLALLALAWRSVRPRPADAPWARELAEWLPLLALPLLYAELPLLIGAAGTSFQDARVLAWERALFGEPARTLSSRWPPPVVSELLHAGYLSYYPLIYLPAIALRARGRVDAMRTTVLAATIAFTACFAVFVVFPVQGPRYLWPAPLRIADGPVRDLTLWLLGAGSSRGAAFPSSHAAVAVALTVTAWRFQPRLGLAAVLSTIGIVIGAVYGGFHYAVDMAAGVSLGLLAGVVALRVGGRHPAGGPLELR